MAITQACARSVFFVVKNSKPMSASTKTLVVVISAMFLCCWSYAFTLMEKQPEPKPITQEAFSKMSVQDFEAFTGRDLRFKEKIVFRLLRKKVRRQVRKNPKEATKPLTALAEEAKLFEGNAIAAILLATAGAIMFFALNGVGILVAPFGLLFGLISLKRQKRFKKYNETSKVLAILGIIVGGAALGFMLVIIFLILSW